MKIGDIEKVNQLIGELHGMNALITHTNDAAPADCELFMRLPGDSSIRMSSEGSASTHYQGFSASTGFLRRLLQLAVEELNGRKQAIIAELALGVDAEQ